MDEGGPGTSSAACRNRCVTPGLHGSHARTSGAPLWPQKHATKSPAHHPMHLRSRPSIAGCTYWRPFGAVGPLALSSPKPRTPARWPCARGAKRELQGRSRATTVSQPSHFSLRKTIACDTMYWYLRSCSRIRRGISSSCSRLKPLLCMTADSTSFECTRLPVFASA